MCRLWKDKHLELRHWITIGQCPMLGEFHSTQGLPNYRRIHRRQYQSIEYCRKGMRQQVRRDEQTILWFHLNLRGLHQNSRRHHCPDIHICLMLNNLFCKDKNHLESRLHCRQTHHCQYLATEMVRSQRHRLHYLLSLIHIWRCRRIERCRSRWSPYH